MEQKRTQMGEMEKRGHMAKWISVKDSLPEELGSYIVAAHDGHVLRVTFAKWQNRFKRWELTGARAYWRITHWMPLPEPPREGE